MTQQGFSTFLFSVCNRQDFVWKKAWSLFVWLIQFSLILTQQPLKSNPTATSELQNIILMPLEQYPILLLFICWPYLREAPKFSSFSLSCVRIIFLQLTWFEPDRVVASPASLCVSDSPAALWLSNHLQRKQPLQGLRVTFTGEDGELFHFITLWLFWNSFITHTHSCV